MKPVLMCCLAVVLAFAGATLCAEERQPNFVIFYVDDMGYGDVGVYGSTQIATPHLDRMAAEGVRFTEYYAPSPICSPSRAGLLTGRYPARYGMAQGVFFPDAETGLPEDEVTLADVLKAAGYRTALFGKWHLGHLPRYLPLQRGFDTFNGIPFSNDMAVNARYEGNEIVDFNPDQRYFTRQFTEAATAYIEEYRDEPFFVLVTHPMPHIPLYASPEFEGRSAAGVYGDVIEEIDWSVGQLRAKLAELGLADNTFVFFTSDNGPWLDYAAHGGSAGALREGKFTTFEGGMRVPAIAAWPGRIEPGRVQDGVLTALDFLPTLAALAGAELPADRILDGAEMRTLILKGGPAPQRTIAYFGFAGLEAIRVGDWKLKLPGKGRNKQLIELDWPGAFPDHGLMLFNLADDPGERNNLAQSHPEKVAELEIAMATLLDGLGPLPPKMKMGSWKEGAYTPDLEGAQKPRNVSAEYREQALEARRRQLGIKEN